VILNSHIWRKNFLKIKKLFNIINPSLHNKNFTVTLAVILPKKLNIILKALPHEIIHLLKELKTYLKNLSLFSVICMAFSRSVFVNLPCLVLDSTRRFRPSLVLGPVLVPTMKSATACW